MISNLKMDFSRKLRTIGGLLLWALFCFDAGVAGAASAGPGLPSSDASPHSNKNPDTISMSFDGALLKDVLLFFSQQSGFNFVSSQEIENKKVTVYFEDVSPKDALSAIMSANGLTYSKKPGSDIYVVYTLPKSNDAFESVTKVIHLKYMRLASSPIDVGGATTIGDLKTSASTSGSSSSSSASSGGSGVSNPDKGADRLVARLLSPQGKVAVDINTNSLIVTDTADRVAQIEKVLEELDVPASQVVLEVYVMEINKELLSDVGVEWGGANDGSLLDFTAGTRTTGFPFTESIFKRQQGVKATTTAASSAMTLGTLSAANFAATLHYLETDADTKILARPRVMTQNNEAATIKLVTNQTTFQSTTATPIGTGGAQASVTNERTEVGIILHMTPQINGDDSVALFLEPAVTTVAPSAEFTTNPVLDPTTRLVRTMARVKNDKTLVIGGLLNGNESITKRKLPLLGDLPFVGSAFRYEHTTRKDRELIIFVTPHILHGSTSLGEHSATSKGRDESLRKALNDFREKEMNEAFKNFVNFQKDEEPFFIKEQELVRASEERSKNPVVQKQMTQALDAMNPDLIDAAMKRSLDSLSREKTQPGHG